MARQLSLLTLLALGGFPAFAYSQEPAPTTVPPIPGAVEKDKNPAGSLQKTDGCGPEFWKKHLDQLSPEQKERFKEKIEKWKALPPEEREMLLNRDQMRRERIRLEVEEVLKNSGLKLDKDRQEMFMLRYTQERHKIEEQLRRELEEKRRPLLKELTDRLTTEFSQENAPTK